jgi:hypothetical protein
MAIRQEHVVVERNLNIGIDAQVDNLQRVDCANSSVTRDGAPRP